MGRIFKFLLFLAVIGFIGLLAYAYVGPYFGADFAEPAREIRVPIDLQAD